LICTEKAGSSTSIMANNSLTEEDFLLTEIKAEVKEEVTDEVGYLPYRKLLFHHKW